MDTNKIVEERILGDFIRVPPSKEYLILSFSSGLIPSSEKWRNNCLSADFIANYLSTCFQGSDRQDNSDKQAEVKSAVSYIANELLENAVKYSANSSPISIQIHLNPDLIIFQLTNNISARQTQQFQNHIETLLRYDPDELYITLLEQNALDSNRESGLGFLTMLNDYKAKLGWRFKPQYTEMSVTTMVQLTIQCYFLEGK